MKKGLTVTHKKLDNGKTLRVSTTDMETVITEKLSNKEMLEKHESQIDIYVIATQEVIDRKYMHHSEAIKFGKEVKDDFPELGYRIIQIVE